MINRRILWAAPAAVLCLAALAGCPARGSPTCPDCRLTAAPVQGDCGNYTLQVEIKTDGGEAGPITDAKLVINWKQDGVDKTSTKVLTETFEVGKAYDIPISKADFPDLCDPASSWGTASPSLSALDGGKPVEFPVTIQ